MKVSIIIPCYNLGQYLDEAIKSVMEQTFTDWELIVIDDGSTDEETQKVLDRLNYAKTKLIRTKNQGLPVARNTGIKLARGKYIACLDADDLYDSQFLEKTVKVLDDDTEQKIGFVTTWVQLFGAKDGIWKTEDYNPILLATKNVVHVASLFRKTCWTEVGGYSESLKIGYQDWDFWLKIVAEGYRWTCLKEPLFSYRMREKSMVFLSNQKRPQLFQQIVENNKKFYEKNFYKILNHLFLVSDKYAVLENLAFDDKRRMEQREKSHEQRIDLKDKYIAELKASKKILTTNLVEKQQYIEELESSKESFKKRIEEKDLYIKELEAAKSVWHKAASSL